MAMVFKGLDFQEWGRAAEVHPEASHDIGEEKRAGELEFGQKTS